LIDARVSCQVFVVISLSFDFFNYYIVVPTCLVLFGKGFGLLFGQVEIINLYTANPNGKLSHVHSPKVINR